MFNGKPAQAPTKKLLLMTTEPTDEYTADDIQDELATYKCEQKYGQLTEDQYIELQIQFDKTPDCRKDTNNTELVPGGQHWVLMQLIRSITGVTPISRQDAVQMADDILSLEYWDGSKNGME